MLENQSEMMTAAEAARRLGTSPTIITAMIKSGKLPVGCVHEGEPGTREKTRTFISRSRFERWMSGDDLRLVAGEA